MEVLVLFPLVTEGKICKGAKTAHGVRSSAGSSGVTCIYVSHATTAQEKNVLCPNVLLHYVGGQISLYLCRMFENRSEV